MQQFPPFDFREPQRLRSVDGAAAAGTGVPTDRLDATDVVALIRLAAEISTQRNDPRAWRLALLEGLAELLGGSVGAAFILKNVFADMPPMVVSLFDAGFKLETARQAFLSEFNAAPFRDPLFRKALERFVEGSAPCATFVRADLVDDGTWNADAHVLHYRRATGLDDCVVSLSRGSDRGGAYAMAIFSAAGDTQKPGGRFSPRERGLLQALHEGLTPVYRNEETTHRLNRATELPPRLRQTLECLLAGDTERQVALKLSLSVHTVHDYVKALYQHFGVSSRGELLSKWIQTSGQLPHTRSESGGSGAKE